MSSGSAFTKKMNQTNILIIKGNDHLMIDCGTKTPQALWEYGLDYSHGTGHGVGFFLNVHEGPQALGSGATAKAAIVFQGYRPLKNKFLLLADCGATFGKPAHNAVVDAHPGSRCFGRFKIVQCF